MIRDSASPYHVFEEGRVRVLKDSAENVIGEFAPYPGGAIVTNDTLLIAHGNLINWRRTFTHSG